MMHMIRFTLRVFHLYIIYILYYIHDDEEEEEDARSLDPS